MMAGTRSLLLAVGVFILAAVLSQVSNDALYRKGMQMLEELSLQLLHFSGDVSVSVTSRNSKPGEGLTMAAPAPSPPSPRPSLAEADVLKQPLAKNEAEIDAQQRISAQRYAEMKRQETLEEAALDTVETPATPDEIRRSMPLERTGPVMRCGEFLPTESRVVTRNVELYTRSEFQGAFGGSQYVWKYFVTFKNQGEETVQMLTRHWVFVDAMGRLSAEVKGPGARGVTPVLPPQGEWTYESGTSLDTPFGSMHGRLLGLEKGGHLAEQDHRRSRSMDGSSPSSSSSWVCASQHRRRVACVLAHS